MICRLSGMVLQRNPDSVVVDVHGLGYEVLVPAGIAAELPAPGQAVTLIIYHYVQSDPSRSHPVLIGFLNDIEKEFFEKFITVSGIGPKAAVRALSQPLAAIAQAIDSADAAYLKALPGIGQQRAREIIAKLQHKVGKFALLPQPAATPSPARAAAGDIEQEALSVLLQLQYKRAEAEAMIKRALARNSAITNVEELLNEVYRQKIQS